MSSFSDTGGMEHLRIRDGVTAQAVEAERTTLAIVDMAPGATWRITSDTPRKRLPGQSGVGL